MANIINAWNISSNRYIFENCTTVVNINCNNIAWIDNNAINAFANCRNLKTVTGLNNNITNVEYCFFNCRSLTNVATLPENITELHQTFGACTNLPNSPTIPNSVTNMHYTYDSCGKLNAAPIIPNSVTNMIGTFINCVSLEVAPEIPNSVGNMYRTFYNSGLINGVNLTNPTANLYETYAESHKMTDGGILPRATVLPLTYKHCNRLVNAPIIPNSVTNLHATFQSCYALENAPIIPSSVTTMHMTFAGCINMVNMPGIPNSVTDLSAAFSQCTSLHNMQSIPLSVRNMAYTFNSCTNLPTSMVILSKDITNATGCFNNTSGIQKDIFLPFQYINNTYTPTYNAFVAAGYSTTDYSKDNTRIHDMDIANVTVYPVPTDANVILNAPGYTQSGHMITVRKKSDTFPGVPVDWVVNRWGYRNESGNLIPEKDVRIDVIMQKVPFTLTVASLTPNTTVTLTADGYEQREGTWEAINGTVIGSLTDNDGTISGFTSTDYLRLPQLTLGNNFELCFKFKYISSGEGYQEILRYNKRLAIAVHTSNNNVIHFNTGDGTNWTGDNADGVTPLVSGNTYWVKVIARNSTREVYISSDGTNYNLECSGNYTIQPELSYYLGAYDSDFSRWFSGSIDLRESYIKVNDVTVWNGYTRKGEMITVDYETVVHYKVEREGYFTVEEDVQILDDTLVEVALIRTHYNVTVTPLTAGSTVTLTCEGSQQVGNTIVAPYMGTVEWSVSKAGYKTESGSIVDVVDDTEFSIELVLANKLIFESSTIGNYSLVVPDLGYYEVTAVGGGGGGSNNFGGAAAGVRLNARLAAGTYSGVIGSGGAGAPAYVRNNDGKNGNPTTFNGQSVAVTCNGGIRRQGRRNGGGGGNTGTLAYNLGVTYSILARTTDGSQTPYSLLGSNYSFKGSGGQPQGSDTGAGYAGQGGYVRVVLISPEIIIEKSAAGPQTIEIPITGRYEVIMVGGGGGSGYFTNWSEYGYTAPGGQAAMIKGTATLTAGTYTVVVGAAGAGGPGGYGGWGSDGGDTTFAGNIAGGGKGAAVSGYVGEKHPGYGGTATVVTAGLTGSNGAQGGTSPKYGSYGAGGTVGAYWTSAGGPGYIRIKYLGA